MNEITSNENIFSWTDFYIEFADKLLPYKNKRSELIQIIEKSFEESFRETNLHFPFTENEFIVEDIDPFSVFGCFNKNIKENNRKIIAKSIGVKIGVASEIPEDFIGIPILNNLKAWFFWGRDSRGDTDIQNLWEVFESAIDLADTQSEYAKQKFTTYYNKVLSQNGVKWNLTMGLYWIRPYNFINLDGTNREYLLMETSPYNSEIQAITNFKSVPNAEDYLKIIELCKIKFADEDSLHKNFPEISRGAWLATQDKNDAATSKSNAAFLKWFSPVIEALKKLDGSGTPGQVREQIIEDLNLQESVINEVRGKSKVNRFSNEVAFARNYLVYAGYLDNSERGLWQLTDKGMQAQITPEIASDIFLKYTKQLAKKRKEEGLKTRYWIYSAGSNSNMWENFYEKGIMAISWEKIGDLNEFHSKKELNESMKQSYGQELSHRNSTFALWQFANDMNIGDIVFVKKGKDLIIGRGIVESDYTYNEELSEYPHIRKVKWTNKGEWNHPGSAVVKTLTDITSYTEYVDKLQNLFIEDGAIGEIIGDEIEKEYQKYKEEDFLKDVFISNTKYTRLINILKSKKNIILQGAPGVGKTYSAKRLAYSIMGVKDTSRVMLIQFHQSYSYEDFIMGYRPDGQGFKLSEGPFYEFCKKALEDDENDYFFIIDEINRGNLSKIFGELLMLIENDKRNQDIRLMYSNELFRVPDNVYIIGMMNTADRSLAMIDYALRRRFAFFNFEPSFDSRGFKDILLEANNDKFNQLIEIIKELNIDISNDDSLGNGFQIGHSYFCSLDEVDDEVLNAIVEYEIIPLLKEYWFDESLKVDTWVNRLRGAINDKR